MLGHAASLLYLSLGRGFIEINLFPRLQIRINFLFDLIESIRGHLAMPFRLFSSFVREAHGQFKDFFWDARVPSRDNILHLAVPLEIELKPWCEACVGDLACSISVPAFERGAL